MRGRAFIDTNVLVYLFDRDAPEKARTAKEVLEAEGPLGAISTQILQEFYVIVTRKLGRPLSEEDAERALRNLAVLDVRTIDVELVLLAAVRSRRDKLAFWDSLVVETALRAGCRRLLTEDLQEGRVFGTLRVENPFGG
ncbi:MAG: PIN domain-containing protein [Thermoanaerobaculia bacterium]|nr:PIN domain-containing protein [Thermoanaerobaculia bacterium]